MTTGSTTTAQGPADEKAEGACSSLRFFFPLFLSLRATKIVEGLLFAVLVAGIKDPARPQCADGRRVYVAAEIGRGATPPVFA